MLDLNINPERPLEELTGSNYGIVRQILGRVHCMSPVQEQLRECRPKDFRRVPVALRRGWVLCALQTIEENRDLFCSVMRGSGRTVSRNLNHLRNPA